MNSLKQAHRIWSKIPEWVFILLIALVSLLLAIRMFRLVDKYAVNVLFYDQFDFMQSIFYPSGIWDMFTHQHGPHRQGLGEWIIWLVARASQWDSRVDAFVVMAATWCSLPLALFLKRKLIGRFQLSDIVLPIIVLNLYQWENYVITPNISHSVLPLILIMLYCLAWIIPHQVFRLLAVLSINFLLTFTGFGMFMGVVTVGVFALEGFAAIRSRNKETLLIPLLGLIGALASWGIFSIGYQFVPAVNCFGFRWAWVPRYPFFMGLMFTKFIGIHYLDWKPEVENLLPLFSGALILLAFLVAFLWHGFKYLRNPLRVDPVSKTIVMLIGFTLLFSAFTSVGRICISMGSAQASRYMTLLIPGFLGLYLSICKLPKVKVSLPALFVLILLLANTLLPLDRRDMDTIQFISGVKENWKACYLEIGDIAECGKKAGLDIYPYNPEVAIKEKLEILEANGWNLFKDQ